jgi:site-specific DNA-methyltransferase (adenine-specific)
MLEPVLNNGGAMRDVNTPHKKNYVYHELWGNVMAKIPDSTVDLVLTDPPYWTLNKWRSVGTTTRLGGHREEDKRTGWFETIDQNELWEFMCEVHRVLKPNRHAVIMGDGQVLRWLLGYSEEAGFSNVKPLVWDKVNQGMGYHFRCRHEYLVLFDKGKNRKPNSLSTPDVFTVPMIRSKYPTEKPVSLMEMMVRELSVEGELVLDPFCGSGSSLLAAKIHGRDFIGGDLSEEAVDLSNKKLSSMTMLKFFSTEGTNIS